MSTSLLSLVNNLSDGLHSDKYTECKSCRDYMSVKAKQWNCIELIFKYLNCNKNHNKEFNKELKNRFLSAYIFCDGDIKKFIFLLRKGVEPYEYMDNWERFDDTSLSNK